MPKIAVFPNDPLVQYLRKGEVKERYFNPCNLFDEVHVISLASEDAAPEQVQTMAGTARMFVHCVGAFPGVVGRHSCAFRARLLGLLRSIAPDVVRCYAPLVRGWLVAWCARRLGVPAVVSIHADYDQDRALRRRREPRLRGWLRERLLDRLERFTMRHAACVICAYQFPASYARRYGARRVEVIYNRVDTQRFAPTNAPRGNGRANILSVGNLHPLKNQECLLRALPGLEADLTLIGDGEDYERLAQLGRDLQVESQVRFVRAVPHAEIHHHYAAADVFATAMNLEGVSIPILEAMAAGLPIVAARSPSGRAPEWVEEVGVVVANTPDAFHRALRRLLSAPSLRLELGRKARERAQTLDGSIMEKRERELYVKLMESEQ